MRKLLLRVVVPVACLLATKTMAHPLVFDSAKINHTTDGNISEWKLEKFETDKETHIQYTVDHDATNLYLAMKITDQQMQMKMMTQGMSLYIDKNGKKKEKAGVEFPLKKGSNGGGGRSGNGRPGGGEGGSTPDPKEMRENLASTMILLKTFGFGDEEEKTHLIAEPNGVNIAFDWDDANNMYIEYELPVSLLGSLAELKDKTLGIGWKLHGMEAPSSAPIATSIQPVGGTGGRGGGGASRGGGGSRLGSSPAGSSSSDSRFKEQSFWTKYALTF